MIYRVVFAPEAEEQLAALYNYIAIAASPDTAARYTEVILRYCERLQTFPHRGIQRDDAARHALQEAHHNRLRCGF